MLPWPCFISQRNCKQTSEAYRGNCLQPSPSALLPSPSGHLGGCPEPQALSLAGPPSSQGRSRPVFLLHDGGVGCGIALGRADESAGAQEAKAGGRDIPGGDLVLAWVPSAHATTHRAGCREGVGLPKAAAVRVNKEEQRSSVSPGPSQPPGCLPGVCSHFNHYGGWRGSGLYD